MELPQPLEWLPERRAELQQANGTKVSGTSDRTVVFVSMADHLGGAERSMLLLASRLPSRGWNAVLLCPSGGLADAARKRSIPVAMTHWFAVPALGAKRRGKTGKRYFSRQSVTSVFGTVANACVLARHLRKLSADIVISNSFHAHPFVLMGGRLAGTKVVWHIRDLISPGWGQRVFSALARRTDTVIAISAAVAETVPGSRAYVIFNPVEQRNAAPNERSLESPFGNRGRTVGFVGRLDSEKGVDVLIRAMAEIPDATLRIAGRSRFSADSYRQELEELADQCAPGRVQFFGEMSGPDDLLAAVNVLAVPSLREPFGRVVVEAFSFGVPVVVSDSGALPEIVHDGVEGLLFKCGDARDLATKLRLVLDNPERAKKMSEAALDSAPRFSPECHADKVATVLNRLAGIMADIGVRQASEAVEDLSRQVQTKHSSP